MLQGLHKLIHLHFSCVSVRRRMNTEINTYLEN